MMNIHQKIINSKEEAVIKKKKLSPSSTGDTLPASLIRHWNNNKAAKKFQDSFDLICDNWQCCKRFR